MELCIDCMKLCTCAFLAGLLHHLALGVGARWGPLALRRRGRVKKVADPDDLHHRRTEQGTATIARGLP